MAITFYYAPLSNATRIHWALEELGIPYEKIQIDLRAGEQKKPAFLALNPNGKVPTVVIDGTPMFESIAIQIALGERYGVAKGLWPAVGSPEHWKALSWLVWGQVSLGGALIRYLHNTSDWVPAETHNAKQAALAMDELRDCLRILNQHLAGRENVAGDHFTLADLDMASVLGWGVSFAKVDLSPFPNVAAWFARAQKRPGMAVAMGTT